MENNFQKKTNLLFARFVNLTSCTPQEVTLEALDAELRGDTLAEVTRCYRLTYARLAAAEAADAPAADREELQRTLRTLKLSLPAFVCGVTLEGGRSHRHIRAYTACCMADFDHVPSDRFDAVYACIAADPHTLLAYPTVSGCGIRVVARVAGEVDAAAYTAAWRTVNEYYARLTGLDYDRQCSNATRMSALCHAPAAVCRPDAQPIAFSPARKAPSAPKKNRGPKPTASKAEAEVRRLVEEEGGRYEPSRHNDYISRCLYQMNRFGVTADDALQWALTAFADYEATHPGSIAATARSCYSLIAEHATRRLPSAATTAAATTAGAGAAGASAGGRRSSLAEVEAFITARFRLRRNLLSRQVEYAPVEVRSVETQSSENVPMEVQSAETHSSENAPVEVHSVESAPSKARSAERGEWHIMDDLFENSLWCSMERGGLRFDIYSLHNLLQSDFVPAYHPLRQYLDALPPWDGTTDYLRWLADRVHCRHASPDEFDYYFRRWFVAMIAAALRDKVVNHEILVLLGPQGSYKSSFFENLLPPELRPYYVSKTNSQRLTKDDLFTIAENLLLNFEEIDSMQTAELNQLKAMTTVTYINERPAYGRNKVRRAHVASFCATGNNLQFLTDTTGSRRWLPFEVERIENPWTADIPYAGIFAQALWLLEHGFRYWFEGEEIDRLNRRNRRFEAPNAARELVLAYFRRPAEGEGFLLMSASQIASRFAGHLQVTPTQVGKVMSELGFDQQRSHSSRLWMVCQRTQYEVEHVLPDAASAPSAADSPAAEVPFSEPELPF